MNQPSAAAPPPRLSLRGLTKRFPDCLANDGIDLDLWPGEIHALVGQNGAGKSTLVKALYGLLQPDGGTIRWQGQVVAPASPAAARALGIAMVFQHFSLFDSLSVAENLRLGLDWRGSRAALEQRLGEVSRHYGLALEPARPVHTLSAGERQRVEIVRCLLQQPQLLIMDEPTSVLTPQEAEALFVILRQLAGEGCAILYISHKLDEILALADRATVLRSGRVVGQAQAGQFSADSLAESMIGSAPRPPVRPAKDAPGVARLEVRQLKTTIGHRFAVNLRAIDLTLRAGEIVGIAGVAGNGQAELLSALSGEWLAPTAETVRLAGRPAGRLGPAERRALGLAVVPEERLGRAMVPELSLAANTLLGSRATSDLVRHGWVRFERAEAFARRIIESFGVVARGPHEVARRLSGGNLQKFVLGREMLRRPPVLVAVNPTWGIDVGAAAAVHQALLELARDGSAVLIISTDLDELFVLSDRIAALCAGRLSPFRATDQTSAAEIGLWMGGRFAETEPPAAPPALSLRNESTDAAQT